MTTFPGTSSHILEVDSARYDLSQLDNAVRAAIDSRVGLSADAETGIVSETTTSDGDVASPFFHVHTLTLETTIIPPDRLIHYYRRRDQENPAYVAFSDLRDLIRTSTDPFVPLTLASTSSKVFHPPAQPVRSSSETELSSVHLYLPSSGANRPLVKLPPLPSIAAKEWLPNSKAWDLQHWLQSALALDPDEKSYRKESYRDKERRIHVKTGLKLCWIPDGEGDDAGVEIKLLITIDVRLVLHAIQKRLPATGHQMLGLVLHSLLPSATSTHYSSESETRARALQHFFACMRPAPVLPPTCNSSQLQPHQMTSHLLPFQTRTVSLLLSREASNNANIEKPSQETPGFWTAYDFGSAHGRFAYCRAAGKLLPIRTATSIAIDRKGKPRALSPDIVDGMSREERDKLPLLLDLSGVRGTMLCEEMGLGKTVEAIALVLLNRHPLSTPRPSGGNVKARTSSNNLSLTEPRRDKMIIPSIDLASAFPGVDSEDVREWVENEGEAFREQSVYDVEAQLHVSKVATTLIVTPPSLLKQWVSEMRRHSPYLRICVYQGWKSLQHSLEKRRSAVLESQAARAESRKRKRAYRLRRQTVRKYSRLNDGDRQKAESESDTDDDGDTTEESSLQYCQRKFVDYVRAHDVVITNYHDLATDMKVALPVPSRSRRSNANYQLGERPRSPLVMVEWWRVIMDEVQLQSDTSDAANMVSLIPRCNSLAVSGTPAKADVKDLMGSLRFLRVPVLPQNHHLWHRLQQPSFRSAFEGLFKSIAVRTTKKEVASEFKLPLQCRCIVPIELSEIELHYYKDTLDRQREILHLPMEGQPRDADWILDRAAFRTCLMTLRQICTHIQVGQLQHAVGGRREQRLHLGRQLMTIHEALEKMRNDHSQEFLTESRSQMRAMIRKAQLMLFDDQDQNRYRNAIALYDRVRDRVNKQVGPVRDHLEKLLGDRDDVNDIEDATSVRDLSQQEREKRALLTAARQNIREMLIIQHQSLFFQGDIHHSLQQQDQEVGCYENAEAVRREILIRPLEVANSSVEKLAESLGRSQAIMKASELQTNETDRRGGILSDSMITQANELLKILNGNAELLFSWRKKIIQLLSSRIEAEAETVDNGKGTTVEDPDKEFYAEALKAQGDVESYLIAYSAAIADRKEFMLEERSLLATHDARVTKQRTTQAARMAMGDAEIANVPDEVAEQAALLMTERQAFRDARQHNDCKRPLKGLLIDLNGITHGPNRVEEVAIAKELAAMLKAYIATQTEYVDELNKELETFRATFNRRVIYFAALQEISDSVAAPQYKDLQKDIEDANAKINDLQARLTRMTVKGRFLQYLGTKERGIDELKEDCIICMGSSDDTHAVLLGCGHFFCNSCFKEFRRSMQGRRCPSCQTDIDDKGISRVKLAGANDKVEEKAILETMGVTHPDASQLEVSGTAEDSTKVTQQQQREADLGRLRRLDIDRMRDIAQMDMMGEYGSKIDFLIKHLLWYNSREPDARHVIFSNWSDSINIVIRALMDNGISHVSLDQTGKKKDVVDQFNNDTSITVFLLHAERESAGLTLTSCRVVHLLEPVLRHSFELQAIGRVDRLGQDRETTVFCYSTMDTVEARILAQGVRNRTSIYLREDEDADNVVASMPNVVSAAHKGGDVSNDGKEEELLQLIL